MPPAEAVPATIAPLLDDRPLTGVLHPLRPGTGPPTPAAMLAAVEALVVRHLPDLAAALAPSCPGLAADAPAIIERLATLPRTEEPADRVAERFERQRACLAARHPHLVEPLAAAAAHVARLRVWRTPAGHPIVLAPDTDDAAWRLALPFTDPTVHAGVDPAANPDWTTLVLPWMPGRTLLDRCLAVRAESGFRPPVDIVEHRIARLAARLASEDLDHAWTDDRVGVHAGPDVAASMGAALASIPTRAPGTLLVHDPACPAEETSLVRTVIDEASRRFDDERHARSQRIARPFEGRTAAWWARRWREKRERGEPLEIALFASRFTTVLRHQTRGLADAFARLGHRATVHTEPNDHSALVDYEAAFSGGAVDLVVIQNRVRSGVASMPRSVPAFAWIQDDVLDLHDRRIGATIGDLDLLAVPNERTYADRYGYPAARLLASTNRTDPDFWRHTGAPTPGGPILYVGHGSETPETLVAQLSAGPFAEPARRFLETVRTTLAAGGWLSWADRSRGLLDAGSACGIDVPPGHPALPALVSMAGTLFDRAVRHQTLEWAAAWAARHGRDLRLVGRGWDTHPTLARWAAPSAEEPNALRSELAGASIVLNVNGYTSLHQRFLDAVAAGATVLTRRNPLDARVPVWRAIATRLRDEGIDDLPGVLDLAARDAAFRARLAEHDEISGMPTAPASDPHRAAIMQGLLDAGLVVAADLADERQAEELRRGPIGYKPSLLDLPGVEATRFATRSELHDLLDAAERDPAAAQAMMTPIRAAVERDHSFVALAQMVLDRFFA